uniref:Putative microvillar protein with insect allergen related repeat n=1 Tax=Nyssomyia neivai TaxID=330878 RepID=A0A1L8DRD0_9DIPT
MKVLICLSLCVAATVALRLPAGFQRPRPEDGGHQAVPPHIPEHISPELEELLLDMHDFVAILPHKQLKKLVKTAYKNDEQLRQTVMYMRTPHFHGIMKEISELPEVHELFNNHEHHFEDFTIRALNVLDEEIDFEILPAPIEPQSSRGGLCGLIDDAIAILPHNELRALHREKVANGGVFAKVVSFFTSDRFTQGFNAIIQSQRFRELDATLRDHGVCLDKFVELPMNVFGFH